MKHTRWIVLLLTLCILAGVASGCAEEDTAAETVSQVQQPEQGNFLVYEYSEEAAEARTYEVTMEDAIAAVAEAYLHKGALVQYDQLWSSRQNNDYPTRASRWNNTFAPELATSQVTQYTDCSKFQNTVYYNTFGYELPAESTDAMLNYPELQVFYYEPTGEETDEEEAQILAYIEDMLQVGDLISYRLLDDSNGHIMMYVGDGMLIHASGSLANGGDYVYEAKEGKVVKTDTLEATGTVLQDSLALITTWTDSNRYLLSQLKFGVLRPMKDMTEADITQDAYCRTAFMQGIVSEITSDCSPGRTVEPGDTITYTLSMQNIDSVTRKIHVDIGAAANTSIIQGETKVDVEIPTGQTVQVQFTVKVDENEALLGQTIEGPAVKANGMTVAAHEQLVGSNLEETAVSALESLDFSQSGVTNDYEMVTWAYEQITGEALPFESVQELMWSVFSRQDYNNVALELRSDTLESQMLVTDLYGGTNVKNCGDEPGSRISNPTAANVQPGDILLVSEDLTPENTYIYLCTKEYTLAQWSGELNEVVYLRTAYMAPVMESLLGQKAFAILRPSFILENADAAALSQPDTSDYQGTVIITGEVEWDGVFGNVEVLSLEDGSKRIVRTDIPGQVYTGRVFDMTVADGIAVFSTPAAGGIYDGTAANEVLPDVVRKASAVSWNAGELTYTTDTGTGTVKTDGTTTIILVSDTRNYGRLTDVQAADTIPAAEGMSWNLLFKTDENGVCQWVIAEREGNDISRSVGAPLLLG